MTLAIKSIKQVSPYVPINIAALEAAIDQLVANSYKISQIENDWIEMNQVIEGIGSDQFLKIYADTLADMLNNVQEKNFEGKDLFNPASPVNMRLTSLRKDHLAEDFDSAVAVIRMMCKVAFPSGPARLQKILNFNRNGDFLKGLANLDPKKMPPNFGSLQEHIKSFSKKYSQFKQGAKFSSNEIKGINSNLQNITGQILWENIVLLARERALEKFFTEIHPGIKEAFFASGGKIVAEGKQAGTETNKGGQQEVADSLVTISFLSKDNSVIASVTTADSTKLSGRTVDTNTFYMAPTKNMSKLYDVGYLINQVGKMGYWENRLQAFLDNSGPTQKDEENWDNTRLGFYLLAMYDTLAVRATQIGQYAQTMSINNKMYMINNMIKGISRYYQTESKGLSGIRSAQNNIFNMGGGYLNYIQKQQKISRGTVGWGNKDKYIKDEPALESNYNDYIREVMATKIAISSNVLF